ncbi:MAG: ABC transporter permease [Bacillota bacterium]
MEFLLSLGEYVAADLRIATPILLAALGLLLMNRSGLINIGAEGIMLIATLVAVAGTYFFKSVWLGMLVAMLSGALMGLLFALLTVTVRSNQIVVGAAFNILGSGMSAMLYRIIFGLSTDVITVSGFSDLRIPLLSDVPALGTAFFSHMPIVYLAFLLVPAMSYFLFKTPAGLNLRSVGENPKAADTLGVHVYRVRYYASVVGGMIIAAGGAFLSTGLLRFFSEEMVAGRGFIALAAVIFGRYKPMGVMIAAMLFALGTVGANSLQALGSAIPYNFLVMIPYLLTIVALAGFAGKAVGPAAAGKPYKKG